MAGLNTMEDITHRPCINIADQNHNGTERAGAATRVACDGAQGMVYPRCGDRGGPSHGTNGGGGEEDPKIKERKQGSLIYPC
mgnify:CR=1 FL=1